MSYENHKESFKAVVFDLDDTLLKDDLSISAETVGIFHYLNDAGISFVAASGRAKMSMRPFLDRLQCVRFYISCNGAEIWDGYTHTSVSRCMFPVETARQIAAFGNEWDCYAQTYSDDMFYYNRQDEYAEKYAAASMLKGKLVGDLSCFIQEERNKILMMADESKIAAMLQEARSRFFGKASVTCSKPVYLEFNPPDATKGNALLKCSDLLGIKPEQFIAFGDSLNDLSMLQKAGLSVAVSNAWPEIRSACDAVCGSNEEDGVAHFLQDFFASGRKV